MKTLKLNYKVLLAVAAGLLVVIAYFVLQGGEGDVMPQDGWLVANQEMEHSNDEEVAHETPSQFFADVKGAVVRPGVYTFQKGDRIANLIELAGGFTDEADQTKVNLAAAAEDAMMIVVPTVDETANDPNPDMSAVIGGGATVDTPSPSSDKVNLNTASEADLTTLPGIGPAKAASIMDKRQELGGFKQIEDLKKVSGIGEKTFEKLKDVITI